MAYERDNIRRLAAYVPGEQPQTQRVIKLNTNENPYPPHAAVLQAIRDVGPDALRRYPSPRAERFRDTAARVHDLDPSQVIATNGGDELLRLAFTAFCNPVAGGDASSAAGGAGVAEPSYSLYPVLAEIQDTPLVRLPLDAGFALPDDFAERLNAAGCRLALVVNPHAPSGRRESIDTLRRVAERFEGVLLIDEAYVDFAEADALPLLREGDLDNVLILRSLSKGYSLAGLRFGYGMGHAGLIAALDKARDSYNADVLSQAAAVAALEQRDAISATWQNVIAERDRLTTALRGEGWQVLDSHTNFILATPPSAGPDARTIYENLKAGGIFVRYFDQDRLRDKLRITVGTPEQNDALLAALVKVPTTTKSSAP
ncbi:histidinol-phosphate transaminase [Phycisphaerales bacterium AB-hyl4]|uniref:Histidinol-phosphate aminotransferase n=1 Tax=Natronomicrosphaera hydrolytica TaxID=3242702 RepID=A0ABV4U0N7_9BACT